MIDFLTFAHSQFRPRNIAQCIIHHRNIWKSAFLRALSMLWFARIYRQGKSIFLASRNKLHPWFSQFSHLYIFPLKIGKATIFRKYCSIFSNSPTCNQKRRKYMTSSSSTHRQRVKSRITRYKTMIFLPPSPKFRLWSESFSSTTTRKQQLTFVPSITFLSRSAMAHTKDV